jgi:hypothetical protein
VLDKIHGWVLGKIYLKMLFICIKSGRVIFSHVRAEVNKETNLVERLEFWTGE